MAPPKVPPGCPLTTIELHNLQRLCDGLTYKQIAHERHRSVHTIRNQVADACQKLGVTGSKQAISIMGRRGWWGWQPPPEPDPLADKPFLRALLIDFDRWLESRFSDQQARDGLHLATRGACLQAHVEPCAVRPMNDPIRDLLQHVAADTLTPSRRTT